VPRAVVDTGSRRNVINGPRAVIGRSDAADCVIPDPNISRRHAELRQVAPGEWEIVDLNSTNGVKVNGRRLPSARLREGDEVTLGTTTFRFGLER
jgi:pSer/pThr/pTyr-binding forkhead associated (FHA) protein